MRLILFAALVLAGCTDEAERYRVHAKYITVNSVTTLMFSCSYSYADLMLCTDVKECNDYCEAKRKANGNK